MALLRQYLASMQSMENASKKLYIVILYISNNLLNSATSRQIVHSP